MTEGEVGIRVWKRKATVESRRNWIKSRGYVPICKLSAVDAEERRRKGRLWYKAKGKTKAKQYNDGRKEEAKKKRKPKSHRPMRNRG